MMLAFLLITVPQHQVGREFLLKLKLNVRMNRGSARNIHRSLICIAGAKFGWLGEWKGIIL